MILLTSGDQSYPGAKIAYIKHRGEYDLGPKAPDMYINRQK
jgi:hypothetical protein